MAFVRVKPLGWVDDTDTITAAQLNQLDIDHERSIDGTGGGTYSPTAVIEVNGAFGLDVETFAIPAAGTMSVGDGAVVTFLPGSKLDMAGALGNIATLEISANSLFDVVSGGDIQIENGGDIIVKNGGTLDCQAGSTITLAGTATADDFTMSGTNRVKLASRSITRVQETMSKSRYAGATLDWDSTAIIGQEMNATKLAARLAIPLHVPDGVTITGYTVYVQGSSADVGLPAAMPLCQLYRVNISSGAHSAVGTSVTDPSGGLAAYKAVHGITKSGLSSAVDRATYYYFIDLVGEDGAGANVGMQYIGASVTYTITAMDED